MTAHPLTVKNQVKPGLPPQRRLAMQFSYSNETRVSDETGIFGQNAILRMQGRQARAVIQKNEQPIAMWYDDLTGARLMHNEQVSVNSNSSLTPEAAAPDKAPVPKDEGFDLRAILVFLLAFRRQIAIGTGASLLAGILTAVLLKPVFTASTVILPPQQGQSASALLTSEVSSLASLGASSALSLKSPNDMYVGILGSREIADHLIDRFQLMNVYHKKTHLDARKELRRNTDFDAAKDGLIYINVEDHDPQRAAALANAYVEELHQANSRLAISQAAQRRLFYDDKLAEEKKVLDAAEEDLKQTQERNGLVQLSGQAEITIRSIASMQAEIASREVELGTIRTYATEENPAVTRLQQEIAALRSQLSKMENSEVSQSPGNTQVPAARVPEVGLEYLRKLREARFHESLYELMAKQRGIASLEEADSAPVIQVVDHAEPPERKSGPSRLLVVLAFTLGGFVLTFLVTVAMHSIRNAIATIGPNRTLQFFRQRTTG